MSRLGREADDRQQEPRGQAGLPVAVRSSEGLGSNAFGTSCRYGRSTELSGVRGRCCAASDRDATEPGAQRPPKGLGNDAPALAVPPTELPLGAGAPALHENTTQRRTLAGADTEAEAEREAHQCGFGRERADHEDKAPARLWVDWPQRCQDVHLVLVMLASTVSVPACCLTFELRRERRYGAWPAGRMMDHSGKRAKCYAGASRLQRRVRPRFA